MTLRCLFLVIHVEIINENYGGLAMDLFIFSFFNKLRYNTYPILRIAYVDKLYTVRNEKALCLKETNAI